MESGSGTKVPGSTCACAAPAPQLSGEKLAATLSQHFTRRAARDDCSPAAVRPRGVWHNSAPTWFMPDPGPMDLGSWAESTSAYVKCRVETVVNRTIIAPSGEATYRFWLNEEQMQRKPNVTEWNGVAVGLDAGLGTLWILVDAAGEITARVQIYWEIPDSPMVWSDGTTTALPLSELAVVTAWDGPIPGRVAFDIILTNGGAASPVTLRADLCARRWGANFERQHFLIDASSEAPRRGSLPAYDPDPEKPGQPRKSKGGACEQRVAKAHRDMGRAVEAVSRSSGPSNPTDMHSPDTQPGLDGRPLPQIPLDGGRRAPDQPGFNNIEDQPHGGAKGFPCTPDPTALDWIAAIQTAARENPDGEPTEVGDPEVGVAFARFGGNLTLSNPAVDAGHVLYGKTLDLMADIVPLVKGASTGIGNWFGRCEGFDALWQDVSLGLEKDRVPLGTLKRIMKSGVQPPGGITEWIDATDEGDTQWRWSETCPWFHLPLLQNPPPHPGTSVVLTALAEDIAAEERCTWFLASMLNLLHATLELAPKKIRTLTTGGDFNTITRSQSAGRLDMEHPQWRARVRLLNGATHSFGELFAHADAHGFDAGSGVWKLTGSVFEGATRGRTWAGAVAVTKVEPALVVPYVDAAADCYQIARLLTMIVVSTRGHGEPGAGRPMPVPHERLTAWAKYYFRAYLSCLLSPAQTLVHELYHVRADNTLIPRGHCESGCGQEKLSFGWVQAIGEAHGLPWAVRESPNAVFGFVPQYLEFGGVAASDGESACDDGLHIGSEITGFGMAGSTLTWRASFWFPDASGKAACLAANAGQRSALLADAAAWGILGSIYASALLIGPAAAAFRIRDVDLATVAALKSSCAHGSELRNLLEDLCWDGTAQTCSVGGQCGS